MSTFVQPADLVAIGITLQLAAVSTVILMFFGIPLSLWLAHTKSPLKFVVETLVTLPLVLPPTVLGFYLLISLSSLSKLGIINWAFSFSGLVVGSVIYSLPFVVRPLQNTFQSIGKRPGEVASTLGANSWERFSRVTLPLSKKGLLTACILAFTHTMGEFGIVLMIGGNIPGKTQVASVAIYEAVESLDYARAHTLSIMLLVFSFLVLLFVFSNDRQRGVL